MIDPTARPIRTTVLACSAGLAALCLSGCVGPATKVAGQTVRTTASVAGTAVKTTANVVTFVETSDHPINRQTEIQP